MERYKVLETNHSSEISEISAHARSRSARVSPASNQLDRSAECGRPVLALALARVLSIGGGASTEMRGLSTKRPSTIGQGAERADLIHVLQGVLGIFPMKRVVARRHASHGNTVKWLDLCIQKYFTASPSRS